MASGTVPTAEFSLEELWDQPFDTYEKLRELGRVVYAPALGGRLIVTGPEDIKEIERNPEVFSSTDRDTPTFRVLGDAMSNKDGAPHKRQREACMRALRPRPIQEHWVSLFRKNTEDALDRIYERGSCDLNHDFAAQLAARNMADMIGLPQVEPETMLRWSRNIVSGAANYAQDPEIWARLDETLAEIKAAVDEVYPKLVEEPDASIISSMMTAPDPLRLEEIEFQVRIIVGGGINEPDHAMTIATFGLLTNPDQLAAVKADSGLWKAVFEEAVRWVAPIGGSVRRVTQNYQLGDLTFEPEDRLTIMFAAANRDEATFSAADSFDIFREAKPHLGFGSGPHMCMGMWMARASIGELALPMTFERLSNLRMLDQPEDVEWTGWMFRGPDVLNVAWDT